MSVPVLWAIPVRRGHESALEAALDDLPADAWRAMAGDRYGVFLGEGELVIHAESASAARFGRDGWRGDGVARLRGLLDTHTAFDPDHPDRFLLRDVRHADEPPVSYQPSGDVG